MSEFGILGVWGQKQEGLLASLAILLGVLNKEKALPFHGKAFSV